MVDQLIGVAGLMLIAYQTWLSTKRKKRDHKTQRQSLEARRAQLDLEKQRLLVGFGFLFLGAVLVSLVAINLTHHNRT